MVWFHVWLVFMKVFNPQWLLMTIEFFGDEMILKSTLLVWKPMVTFNGLVSCVISLHESLWPSMTSTGIYVHFFTTTNLYCHISSLSMKHANTLKSKSVWASIVTSSLHPLNFIKVQSTPIFNLLIFQIYWFVWGMILPNLIHHLVH